MDGQFSNAFLVDQVRLELGSLGQVSETLPERDANVINAAPLERRLVGALHPGVVQQLLHADASIGVGAQHLAQQRLAALAQPRGLRIPPRLSNLNLSKDSKLTTRTDTHENNKKGNVR